MKKIISPLVVRLPEWFAHIECFNPALLIGDVGFAAWLALAQRAFAARTLQPWPQAVVPALLIAVLAWALRWHDFRDGRIGRFAYKGLLLAVTAGTALGVLKWIHVIDLTLPACLWLAGAAGLILFALRAAYFATRAAWPDQPLEMVRWLALIAATTALISPFFTVDSIGAGDAHWYTIMLADFVTQLRAGVFPVWVGQSIYAFNGATFPLRMAPWFQHAGGLLDLLTCRALSPLALKNALLVVNALAGVISAYICLRNILHRRPGIAALLAWLWVASPGVLTPLMIGDQYMTFMALPFVPPVLYGCWRNWHKNDRLARVLIATGLAGLWLSHSPVALWFTLFAAGHYMAHLLVRREWRREPRRVAGMVVLFLSLGSLPFVSVAALDNVVKFQASGSGAAQEIQKAFPGNVRPIDPKEPGLRAYQLGYAVMGAGITALFLALRFRPPGTPAFIVCSLAILPFVLPIPWLTRFLWTSLPSWFVTINNIWPMQRLFLIWTAVLVFLTAVVLAEPRLSGRRSLAVVLGFALLAGGAWSWREAGKLQHRILGSRIPGAATVMALAPENIVLTRYAYASFAWVPAYFSHGYMAPDLENRLLAQGTGEIILSNADAAAPLLSTSSGTGTSAPARLEQSGVLTARAPVAGRTFDLDPPLHLTPGRYYALRLDFLSPNENGVFQIAHHPQMLRKYYLPDSGFGVNRSRPSRAFGSEPQCSRIIPLRFEGTEPITPMVRYFPNEDRPSTFPFARFWLYTYSVANLPVAIESWMPYKAKVASPVTAWLETPRIWLPEWRAKLNGRDVPVKRSPENLVAVAVPPGESHVTVKYRQRPWLNLIYWVTLLSWGALLTRGMIWIARMARDASRASSCPP